MHNSFGLEDVSWMVSGARKLWANQTSEDEMKLRELLSRSPEACLDVPRWVRLEGDPFGSDYRDQILGLWQTLFEQGNDDAGKPYNVAEHEQDAAYDLCPIRFPGYMARRDPDAVRHAAYEFAMLGDILVHSGLSEGMRALEYGAGSGNVAINLARLGVVVDTVDISEVYCGHIQQNADFFGVSLTPHNEEFGFDPGNGTVKYDCIIFHACFHHSIDHANLVGRLADLISDDGVILLSNEPITPDFYCPWGLRTDAATISVIAGRGWMELGFRYDYLRDLFLRKGMLFETVPNTFSGVPLFVARKIVGTMPLNLGSPYSRIVEGGHQAEAEGTWTRAETRIPISSKFLQTGFDVEVVNHFPHSKVVDYSIGSHAGSIEVSAAGSAHIVVSGAEATDAGTGLVIKTVVDRPSDYFPGNTDHRELGIILRSITFQ